MSLKQRISRSVDKAFIALDDLAGPMTLRSQTGDPTYDATSGTMTKNERTFTVQAIFDKYETDRVDGTVIQKEDRLILVKPQTDLRPKVGDNITDAEGIMYEIMDVESITAYDEVFLWELQARK
ncbi:MAG: hypothetical protein QNJ81_02235 [Acidimicrobiia bacterium]|nr:hypothetical protein [Acidimicrobiia bacterium]